MEGKMDIYFKGQILRIGVEFRDNAGELADPTTLDFSWKVDFEDSDSYEYGTDPEIVRDSLGVYYVDLTLSISGTYVYQYIAGGLIENAIEDTFLVITELDTKPLVELNVAKDFLRVSGTDDDGIIHIMLLGIEATIKENLSGYVVAQESTIYLDGGKEFLSLPRIPVSEAEGEEILIHDDIYDVDVDEEFYRLIPTTGQIFYNNEAQEWPEGRKRYMVTYTSGFSLRDDFAEVLERIKLAEMTWLADIYWNRGASTKKETIDEVTMVYEMTKDIPSNVRTLLQGLLDVLSDF
jgi:hypothetical protein